MMAAIKEDNLFAVIVKGSLGLLAVLTLGSLALFSGKAALGVLAGGSIAILNFLWMRNALQRILGLLPANATRYALMRYISRMIVTGCALYFVLTSEWFSLAGVLTGLSIIVINILTLSLYRALSTGG
ncbi:MAG: ATP synthase subunit I [Geobacteraceae bacterium]|nr:ATP synthase subunit I [Geobacteraceae bacterium]